MMVRIAVVVLLLGLVAVARPAPAQARMYECGDYLEDWLDADAIFQAYVVSEFRVDDDTTGYHLDVTRAWKGRAPKVVTAYTGPRDGWYSSMGHPPIQIIHSGDGVHSVNHRVENIIYYEKGYWVDIDGVCSERRHAEEFAGSELGALRIINYSLWGATVVGTAVLALILRAAWRRRAVG